MISCPKVHEDFLDFDFRFINTDRKSSISTGSHDSNEQQEWKSSYFTLISQENKKSNTSSWKHQHGSFREYLYTYSITEITVQFDIKQLLYGHSENSAAILETASVQPS